MKRLQCLFLALTLLAAFAVPVFAVGEGNVNNGGGDMNGATDHGSWSPGAEGVRVTVVRANDHAVVSTPIDVTNKTPSASIYHFGKVSKLQYRDGASLSPVQGGYACIVPPQSIPRIISTSGVNNIDAIKQYFCSEFLVQLVANHIGMDYDILINGNYKLLLEPLAYYTYNGVSLATTATEAALYDQIVSGDLRYWMGTLTHQNLPFAMYLETADLGYPAWTGGTRGRQTNADILSSLGLGIVRFKDAAPEPPEVTAYDYTYRVGTEVITSVMICGGQSDPDHPVSVSFRIGGTTYHVGNVYYPEGDSQLAWVRWTTPSTPQNMVITVNVSCAGATQTAIHCKIVALEDNPPPNPVADDRNDSFRAVPVPGRPESTAAAWGIWRPEWHSNWVWHTSTDAQGNTTGWWCDHGWWIFHYERHSASLSAAMRIIPDSKTPTASGRTIRSGYGLQEVASANVGSTLSSAVTPIQNAVSYFPEFQYQSFWRLLERTGGYSGSFEFRKNPYSTYNGRTYFTPIWYPDGPYTVNTWLLDCWTPVGMLSANLTDSLTIRGSLWDDWHIAPLRR